MNVGVVHFTKGDEVNVCPRCLCAGDIIVVRPEDTRCDLGHEISQGKGTVATVTKVDVERREITLTYDAEVRAEHPMWKGEIK